MALSCGTLCWDPSLAPFAESVPWLPIPRASPLRACCRAPCRECLLAPFAVGVLCRSTLSVSPGSLCREHLVEFTAESGLIFHLILCWLPNYKVLYVRLTNRFASLNRVNKKMRASSFYLSRNAPSLKNNFNLARFRFGGEPSEI